MKTNTRIHFLFTLGLLFLFLSCGPDGSDILRPSDILDITQTLLAETKESPDTQAPDDSSGDDTPDSQTSVLLDTPDAVEITHYSNWQLTERALPTVRDGITIFTKVVFAKNAPYRVANDSSARPDIRYVLSRSAGSKVERRYSLVPRDATGSDFVSADCKPVEDTKVFVCKYTLPVSDFTEFSVNVLGIVLDGTSLKIDAKRGREQQEVLQQPGQQLPTSQVVSFEQDLLPILRARCAFAGCHVAGGPGGIDLSTYQSFIRGGNDGPIFRPGNARSSDIIEEIVSGRMPIGGPQLSNAEIQLFIDWINNQEITTNRPIDESPETQTPKSTDGTVSFQQDLLPILTARCAYSGCHDANGPYDLDFRTYQTFIRSAEDEDVFVPGNARSSDIIEEIVSGRMPLGGPSLTAPQIQLFRDWINQQDPADFPNLRYHDDDDDDEDEDDDDEDDEDDDDEDDEDDEDDDEDDD